MSICPRCGESRSNPDCPVCRRHQQGWDDQPEPVDYLTCIGILLVVATVLYFGLHVVAALVR